MIRCLKLITDLHDSFNDYVLTPYHSLMQFSSYRRGHLLQQIKFSLEETRRKIVHLDNGLDMIQRGVFDKDKEKAWDKACEIYPRATHRLEDLVVLLRMFYQENIINNTSVEEFLNCVDHEHGVPDQTILEMKHSLEAVRWYFFSVVSDLVYLACRDHHMYYKIEDTPPCYYTGEGPPCFSPLY